jgi:tRNA G18 (ribose-2'-O)-methylase SpoU
MLTMFDDIYHAIGPRGEHDFGSINAECHTSLQIDYGDQTLASHSSNPLAPVTSLCWPRNTELWARNHQSCPRSAATDNSVEPQRRPAKPKLRRVRRSRQTFESVARWPITVVLDRVRQNYNIGAILRLCDAFLVERLVVCGTDLNLRKRRLVQAAAGAQRWVPSLQVPSALPLVTAAKAAGSWVIVAEQTAGSVPPDELVAVFPACLILGSERDGVGQELIDLADSVVAIPMLGMANSINVSTAAAILLYWLSTSLPESWPVKNGSSRDAG